MINVIFGEEFTSKDSLVKKNTYLLCLFAVSTNKYPPYQHIIFTLEDGKGVLYPHDDPMVIVVDIDGFIVKRVLVDSRSSCNMLT